MAYSFRGGIHPGTHADPGYKSATNTKPIEKLALPDEVILPVSMHIGAPAKPIVSVGDTVDLGQPIAEAGGFVSAPVHATVSGKVKAIEPRLHPNGSKVLSIVIENDGEDRKHESVHPYDFASMSNEERIECIRSAGIVGHGGATFPTHVKIQSGIGKCDTVIINAAECEPYITSDHRLLLERPEETIGGLKMLADIMGVQTAIIAIEENKKDTFAKIEELIADDPRLKLYPLTCKYPQGAEKQLINACTGREVPSGKLPADAGCAVFNVDTAGAVYRRFTTGMPVIRRIVTISGSAVADTAGVSGMFMPEMVRKGYSKNFTVAVTAISSTIGIIIPPSIPMVVIAGICGISTGKLFLGGIIPGVLCGLAQMIVSYFMAKKEGVPKEPGHFTIGPVLHGLWESWPALLMPIIIVGTITMGIVSPTEAGVIAVVYGLFAGGIIYRELKWEDIKFAFAETVRTSGRIFIVIGAAKLYTVMLTTAGFDKWVAKTMLGFSTNPTVILIMILLIFFIVTMFMESIATLTLFMPILYPIALGVGIDPIVLSVLITVVIGVGLVTPPVGMCIYVACDLMDVTVGEVFPTLVPFIAATFVCIALMVAFPQLILLPTYLMA